MRHVLRVLVAVTSVLTVASPVFAGSTHTPAGDLAYINRMVFDVPLREFVRIAGAPADRWYDWSTDLCSAPMVGSTGRTFDFRDACRRHDFGYRNLQRLESRSGTGHTYWNGTTRRRVDQQLLADMKAHCRNRHLWDQPSCYAWAATFYAAVRAFGGP